MKKQRILMVDDRPENLLALERMLEDLDLDLLKASSGNEALGLMLEKDFALVLLDVQMPGMDGYEVAELMRQSEKAKHIPLVFLTAFDRDGQYAFKGYEAGAVDYLYKPIVPEILRSKVMVFANLHHQRAIIQQQLDEIKTLRGILPICSHCKKVRDDKGYWETIESYISAHSEAEFSHGLCPKCIEALYPESADKIIQMLEGPEPSND